MMMALLQLSMRRHPCHRQDGRLPCNNGVIALDLQRCCCPCCDCVIAILKLAPLPSLQWCCHHHQCHCPCCLLASWHHHRQCAGIFAGVTMENVALVTMAIAIVDAQVCLRRYQASVVALATCCQAGVVTHIAMALLPSMCRVFAIVCHRPWLSAIA